MDLRRRAESLECGARRGPSRDNLPNNVDDNGVHDFKNLTRTFKTDSTKRPDAESRTISNLDSLTDSKDAFRQWDAKLVNALEKVEKG